MPGKSFSPSEHEIKIQGILNGNVESYVRWAEIQVQGLQRDRVHLRKKVNTAEQRCAAAERLH
eukprot:4151762-Prymnesium_polylepis.1